MNKESVKFPRLFKKPIASLKKGKGVKKAPAEKEFSSWAEGLPEGYLRPRKKTAMYDEYFFGKVAAHAYIDERKRLGFAQ